MTSRNDGSMPSSVTIGIWGNRKFASGWLRLSIAGTGSLEVSAVHKARSRSRSSSRIRSFALFILLSAAPRVIQRRVRGFSSSRGWGFYIHSRPDVMVPGRIFHGLVYGRCLQDYVCRHIFNKDHEG